MAEQTPREFALAVLNNARADLSRFETLHGEANLITYATAQAQIAIAAALLDVADAVRGDGGASAERAMERMTEALREATGRRET